MFLNQTLNTLKSQLDDNKLKVISQGGEIQTIGFQFNQPINYDCLQQVKENKNWYLPNDYEAFLLEHNGAKMFELYLGDTNIGGGLLLYSLEEVDRKSTRLNSSHVAISYAVFCLKNITIKI